jgi:hypothetical protein
VSTSKCGYSGHADLATTRIGGLIVAFKLTYTDGQESDYDDGTKWDVDGGVLKLGREDGEWTVFVSPGHWATIELAKDTKQTKDKKDAKDEKHDKDDKDDKDGKDTKDKDAKDDD